MGDVQAAQPLRCEQAAHRFAGELRIAFLANPAGLPAIVELGGGGAEMIDEIRRHAVAADEARETLTGADEQGGGSIAIGEFVFGGRTRASLLRRGATRAAAIGRTASLDQGAGAGTLALPSLRRKPRLWPPTPLLPVS